MTLNFPPSTAGRKGTQCPEPLDPVPTILLTFHCKKRMFMMARSGQGPFSLWVMMGVRSPFHVIHFTQ